MIKPATEIKEYKKWDNFPLSLEEYKKQLQKVLGSQIKAKTWEFLLNNLKAMRVSWEQIKMIEKYLMLHITAIQKKWEIFQ